MALATADQWAVPHDINPSLIPGDVNNTNLWKLVRGRDYGIGVIIGAILQLLVNTFMITLALIAKFAERGD
ncbi:hypothetical protein RB601_003632 [Gaeumannomyces tritici]